MNNLFLLGFWLLGVSAKYNRETSNHPQTGYHGNDINWLRASLTALERAINFFEKNYDQINLDGIFGLRVAQGQLQGALSFVTSFNDVPPEVRHKVVTLTQKARRSGDNALPYLEHRNRTYYQQFEETISGPYRVPYTPRRALDVGFSSDGRSPVYLEEIGDACFVQLGGKQVPGSLRQILGDEPSAPCTLSPACISMMLKNSEKKRGYALTHQLLFLIQAQRLGCDQISKYVLPNEDQESSTNSKEKVNAAFSIKTNKKMISQKQTADAEQYLCDQIYSELLNNIKMPEMEVYDIYQDLFLEQSVLCGMIGFENFLQPEFLRKIISWQSQSGCFALKNEEAFAKDTHHSRMLLEEHKLPDGCLSHKSGLGTALLGIYVRHLVENEKELNYL